MAKKVHEVPKKRQLPLWAKILIICVLLVAACSTTYAAFQHVNNSAKNESFVTIDVAVGI